MVNFWIHRESGRKIPTCRLPDCQNYDKNYRVSVLISEMPCNKGWGGGRRREFYFFISLKEIKVLT